MALPPPGVPVGYLDQLGKVVGPIADHTGREPLGRRHHPIPHHQQPVVAPRDLLFHQQPGAVLPGQGTGLPDLLRRGEVEADPLPLVAIVRLDNQGITQFGRRPQGLLFRMDQDPRRDGNARPGQKLLGQGLVTGDVHPNTARPRRNGSLDPLLIFAVAQLEEAPVVEALDGDPPFPGRFGYCRRAGPQPVPLHNLPQPGQAHGQIGQDTFPNQTLQQFHCQINGLPAPSSHGHSTTIS